MVSKTAVVSVLSLLSCFAQDASALGLGAASDGNLGVCPGESDRYGDHKCNHDGTHRVCAQLLDSAGKPMSWGSGGDFWAITGQKAFQWDSTIRANHGDSWCICMWATARMIEKVGCDNVHLRCDATDVQYVLNSYHDTGVSGRVHSLSDAHECLKKKCGGAGENAEEETALFK